MKERMTVVRKTRAWVCQSRKIWTEELRELAVLKLSQLDQALLTFTSKGAYLTAFID